MNLAPGSIMPNCSRQGGVVVSHPARIWEVVGSSPSSAILLFGYLMLHLDYILYAGSLYGEVSPSFTCIFHVPKEY